MLNPEDGTFEEIAEKYTDDLEKLYAERPETRDWKKFKVGERVEVMGFAGEELVSKGWFMIRKITKKDLILRPMKTSTTDVGNPPHPFGEDKIP